jgi:hypothetical protein
MTELPFDLLEKIADMADIDTRRHMGFPPRKLCTERLKAMENKIRRRSAMQYRFVENAESLLFWCYTILPVNNVLMYIFYIVSFEEIYFSAIMIKQLDRITIDDGSIRWRSNSHDHAIHVNSLFTEKQTIYTTFAIMDYHVCLTSENINAIRQALPT